MTPPLDIVDAHQHFWDLAGNRHPWLAEAAMIPFRYGDYAALKRDYLPADYRADSGAHRVVATVHVEAEWDPGDPIGETRWLPAPRGRTRPPSLALAEALAGWRAALALVAREPNVVLKISGLGVRGGTWRREANAAIVRDAISILGIERCMFGSNFPVDSLVGSFDAIFSGFKAIVADLPIAAQRKLFHDNAMRIYRIPANDSV